MTDIRPLLPPLTERLPRLAIFMSGSGSNAEKILTRVQDHAPDVPFEVAAIVTDAPDRSRARELGRTYDLDVAANDIRDFYAERGERRVSIRTAKGQQIRQEWTDALRDQLAPLNIDFAVFAGFVPLTNLTGD